MPSGRSCNFPDEKHKNRFRPEKQAFSRTEIIYNMIRLSSTGSYSTGIVTDVGYFFPVQIFWEATLVFVCSDQTPG